MSNLDYLALEPERIVSITRSRTTSPQLEFLLKCQRYPTKLFFISNEKAKELMPDLVIEFYERHINWFIDRPPAKERRGFWMNFSAPLFSLCDPVDFVHTKVKRNNLTVIFSFLTWAYQIFSQCPCLDLRSPWVYFNTHEWFHCASSVVMPATPVGCKYCRMPLKSPIHYGFGMLGSSPILMLVGRGRALQEKLRSRFRFR